MKYRYPPAVQAGSQPAGPGGELPELGLSGAQLFAALSPHIREVVRERFERIWRPVRIERRKGRKASHRVSRREKTTAACGMICGDKLGRREEWATGELSGSRSWSG